MCLPTGAGEDASPLGLRPVGAAEDGENPTHGGGWTLAAATRSEFLGVDEAGRVNARVEGEDQRREMRRLAGERAVFIADPRGSGASRLRTQEDEARHVAAVGWEGSVRGGSLSPPDAAPPRQRGPSALVSAASEPLRPSDLRCTVSRGPAGFTNGRLRADRKSVV